MNLASVALVGVVAVERLVELVIARRHASWVTSQGGIEYGRGHYPWMVALHAGLLAGCLVEPIAAARPFNRTSFAWGLAALAVAQALRWWTIATLGRRWTTRVFVVPGWPLVSGGPFEYLRHPNYLAVAIEVAALPLAVGAWTTAVVCTVLNAVLLLAVRIPCEDRALGRRGGAR